MLYVNLNLRELVNCFRPVVSNINFSIEESQIFQFLLQNDNNHAIIILIERFKHQITINIKIVFENIFLSVYTSQSLLKK